jgi:hypothetical protein
LVADELGQAVLERTVGDKLRQTDLTALLECPAHAARQLRTVDIDLVEQCGRVDVLVPAIDIAVDG